MIVSACNNSELEEAMLAVLQTARESQDTHLGRSWEIDESLPEILGTRWVIRTMFGVRRALLENALPSKDQMMEMLQSADWIVSSVYNVPATLVPFAFATVHKLPYIEKVERGWTTFKAVWSAPDGHEYVFRQEMSGTAGYCMVYKY